MITIQNDCLSPYFNLALEDYLFHKPDDEVYFWLWQNDNTVVIGKNQDAYAEVDRDYCEEHGIHISRRMTGGGAVYHDLGNINFTFIVPNAGSRTVDFQKFTDPVAKALSRFGVKAEHSGRNDLLIDGRKFSGNAQFVGRDKVIHHGTLMYSSDLSVVEKCLTPNKQKLQSHGVSSTKSRVTTIIEHMPVKISLREFYDQLLAYIVEAYDDVTIRPLTSDERAAVEQLRDTKYGTREWVFGRSPTCNFQKSERFEGCGGVHVALQLEGGVIREAYLSGDFFGAGDVRDIEQALRGVPHERAALERALEGIDLPHIIHNLPQGGLLDVLL